jgi:CubicO group peptidase (beta-lactamase class C family)
MQGDDPASARPRDAIVSGSLPDDVVDRLTDFAARTQRAETLPALVIGAMTTAGSGTLCLGVAENDPAVPATPTTRFRLSSLIKPFTAVAVLQLVEEGLLDPDEPVVAHLNGIALPGDITVRQLLTHTSGLLRYYGYFHVDAAEAIPDLVDYYREHPLQRREGDHLGYEYSNHNYAVLGQLVEEMRGRPYADVVGDGVLEPLGMTMTTFDDRADGATGYALEGGAVIPSPVYRPVLTPASGGWSTLDDLLRFLGFFVHPAPSPVLGAATTSLMRTNQSPVPGHRRGLGFALESLDGADVVSHIGGWPGYCGAVAFVPDEGIGVALLANRSTEARSDLPHGMLRCVLDSA